MRSLPLVLVTLILAALLALTAWNANESDETALARDASGEREGPGATHLAASPDVAVSDPTTPGEPRSSDSAAIPAAASPSNSLASESGQAAGAKLPTKYTLWGALLDERGSRIEVTESRIDFYRANGERASGEVSVTAYTAAGLSAGTWTWIIRGHGIRTTRGSVELGGAELAKRVDLTLERRPLVRVLLETPDGEGWDYLLMRRSNNLPRIDAIVTREQLTPDTVVNFDTLENLCRQLNRRGAHKRYFSGAPSNVIAELTLREDPPLYISLILSNVVLKTRELREKDREVLFTLDPEELSGKRGGFRGRVLSALDATPVSGARIDFYPRFGNMNSMHADAQGVFEISNMLSGEWRIVVVADGFAKLPLKTSTSPESTQELGDLHLEPAVELRGQVIDTEGKGVLTTIWARRLDAPGESPIPWQVLRMFRPGELIEDRLVAGLYRLEPEPPLGPTSDVTTFRPVVVDLRAGSKNDLVIEVVQGTRLTLQPANEDVTFELLPADGAGSELPVWTGSLQPEFPAMRYFAPGTWILVSRDRDGGEQRRRTLELGAEGLSIQLGE